jgi:hypothetical protein
MSEARTTAPWHLWVVGTASLLWYAAGAYTLLRAQYGTLSGMEPDEVAYYAARPVWLELLTDLSLATTVAGSIALLLRSRFACALFTVAAVVILSTNMIEIINGNSRVYANTGAPVATCVIALWVVLNVVYSHAMRRRGVLG